VKLIRERRTDILIVGGGLGGVAAALAAAHLGKNVVLTEQTDWIGGQLTSQAVPPDEHPWIEATGSTASYRRVWEAIRGYYRRCYPLLPRSRFDPKFNPGKGWVSGLCHEPRVALAALFELLAPQVSRRAIEVLEDHRPIAVETEKDSVRSVTLEHTPSRDRLVVSADYVLDATELGDLLELAHVEHVIGAEASAETGEPHALADGPDPLDQQAVTWCYAIDYIPGEDHTIQRPIDYDFWRHYQADFWPGPQLGWVFIDPATLEVRRVSIFEGPTDEDMADLWQFRRILYRTHYPSGTFKSDITIVNWPQNDYWLGNLIGVSAEEAAKLAAAASASPSEDFTGPTVPWVMKSPSMTAWNLTFNGVKSIRVWDQDSKSYTDRNVLDFTASSITITSMVTYSIQNGQTVYNNAGSGTTTTLTDPHLMVTSMTADLYGLIGQTYDPEHLPPLPVGLTVPLVPVIFTNVVTVIGGLHTDGISVPGFAGFASDGIASPQ